eukprot:828814-Lingulodinium_polyedra.AAC.1
MCICAGCATAAPAASSLALMSHSWCALGAARSWATRLRSRASAGASGRPTMSGCSSTQSWTAKR